MLGKFFFISTHRTPKQLSQILHVGKMWCVFSISYSYHYRTIIVLQCSIQYQFLFCSFADLKKNESRHPTLMIRRATLTLLRTVSIATGIYSESTQKEAVSTLCGLMRNVVDCGCNFGLSK